MTPSGDNRRVAHTDPGPDQDGIWLEGTLGSAVLSWWGRGGERSPAASTIHPSCSSDWQQQPVFPKHRNCLCVFILGERSTWKVTSFGAWGWEAGVLSLALNAPARGPAEGCGLACFWAGGHLKRDSLSCRLPPLAGVTCSLRKRGWPRGRRRERSAGATGPQPAQQGGASASPLPSFL